MNNEEEVQQEKEEKEELDTESSVSDEEKIKQLEEKIKELEDANLRTHADFENTKKRLQRDKAQALEYAYESFAKEILPVIDSLEAAIYSVAESSLEGEIKEKFKEGLDLTLDNFRKVLEKYGIVSIATDGEFDPHLHNAIMQEESDEHSDGAIIQTLQKGYQYKERVLRPALVKVCKNN